MNTRIMTFVGADLSRTPPIYRPLVDSTMVAIILQMVKKLPKRLEERNTLWYHLPIASLLNAGTSPKEE